MNAITEDYVRILKQANIDGDGLAAWDPYCGDGALMETLTRMFGKVYASDPSGSEFPAAIKADPHETAPPGVIDWIITRPPKDEYVRAAWRFMDVAGAGFIMLSGASAFFRRRTFTNLVSEVVPETVIFSPQRRKYGKSMYDFPMAAIWTKGFNWDGGPTTLEFLK